MKNLILTPIVCGANDNTPFNNNYELYLLRYNLKQELNKQLEKYIAVLKHDIKTPVLAQIRAVELLLSSYYDKLSETQRDLLANILESCNEQCNIINNLITTMKYKQDEFILKKTYFDLMDILKTNIKNFKQDISSKGLRININFPSSQLNLHADRQKIFDAFDKIFKNVFSKAAKFSQVNIYVKEADLHSNLFVEISGESLSSSNGFQYMADKEVFIDNVDYNSVGYELEFQLAADILNAHNGSLKSTRLDNRFHIEIKLPLKKED